jgi:hypothetical protein
MQETANIIYPIILSIVIIMRQQDRKYLGKPEACRTPHA